MFRTVFVFLLHGHWSGNIHQYLAIVGNRFLPEAPHEETFLYASSVVQD
jgi:hypothetical protein